MAAFNFDGGTLAAARAVSTDLPMTLGTSGGGATFDTAGFAVTLAGPISGPGILTLNNSLGTGTLILTASNTYSGGTTVSRRYAAIQRRRGQQRLCPGQHRE